MLNPFVRNMVETQCVYEPKIDVEACFPLERMLPRLARIY